MGKNGNKWENLAFFIGSAHAKVDDAGRLRIPSEFLNKLLDKYGNKLFLTSIDGSSARLYPMDVWYNILQKLQTASSFNSTITKFLNFVNYYGKELSIDSKGRVLIHPLLREKVKLKDEIIIIGNGNYLTLWNKEIFETQLLSSPLTEEELDKLSQLGV